MFHLNCPREDMLSFSEWSSNTPSIPYTMHATILYQIYALVHVW